MKDFEHKDYFDGRWCFHGDENKVVAILDSYAQNQLDLSDVNNVFQLYHTKLFFDKVIDIPEWTAEKYVLYKELASKSNDEVRKFFLTINEQNIVEIYNDCYVTYWDDFWMFLCQFKIYETIQKQNFIRVVKEMGINPYKLLSNKAFVTFFDEELTELLKDPDYGAGLLVEYYLEKHSKPLEVYLPKNLTPEIKYQIIIDYIEGDHANCNLLNLVVNGKASKEFPIDDKLRFKAKKRFEKIWDDPNIHMISQQYGMGVSFGPDMPEKSLRLEDHNLVAEYNVNWVRENKDYPTLLNNFIYLFDYTDLQMRCQLTSVKSQRGAVEDTFIVDGKTMYKYGHSFIVINGLSNAQMGCYKDVLERENVFIEDIIKWFFENYLKDEFNVEGFVCSMPAQTDSILSKYERFASVMDGITKQFKLYVEEGHIDREYYEMSSGSIRFKDIPSYISNKYAYCNSTDLNHEMNAVFSDQSTLSYTEKNKAKYETLFELICNEKLGIADFHNYQIDEINWLIGRGIIEVVNDVINFNPERLVILSELYHKEVICLQYHKSKVLKELIDSDEIRVGSSLLSELESQYFDYYLNKAEFTNGLDLRNKYIHDTGSLDENIQKQDYIVLLKLMIILVIKINEEFCLRDRLEKGEGDFYEL